MRVVIDIQAGVAQRAGVGRYTKSLVEHLGAFAASDELNLFYFDFQRRGIPFPVARATSRAVRWCPGRIVQKAWKTLGWPPFDWFAGKADVYHFPNFIRPPLSRGRSVVTIHDVSFLRHPDTTEPRNLQYLTAQIRNTVDRADAIITDSAFAAREIEELFGTPAGKVTPILLGLDPSIRRPSADAIATTQKSLGLDRPYVLMVSTIEPRKNIAFLVEVFERMAWFDGDLVLAGARGWKCEPIFQRIAASKRKERIRHLDYVPDAQLPALYAGAELFLFPSRYEGFGFPPLEAMACGTPVLSSRGGSLPEVLGGAAEYAESFDAGAWAARAEALLADGALRAARVKQGLDRAREFTWDEAARKTWAVYRKVAG